LRNVQCIMPPRRGGGRDEGDAEVETRGGDAGFSFPDLPARRLHPWTRDNHNCNDIFAGTFDASGKFDGIVISNASMAVLTRYFQLGMSALPRTVPPEVSGLGTQMSEGYPTIVLTRGTYGRDMDVIPGPARNSNQAELWGKIRRVRTEMPSLHITCIDIPASATMPQVGACLQPPLSDYRELAFYDGTWYTPDLVSNPYLGKQVRDVTNLSQKRREEVAAKTVQFQRKAFPWRTVEPEHDLFELRWKAVQTDKGFVRPVMPAVAEPKPKLRPLEASVDTAKLVKQLPDKTDDRAADMLSLAQFLLKRKELSDDGQREALAAAKEALELIRASDDKPREVEALKVLIAVHFNMDDQVSSLALATELRELCRSREDGKGELEAVQLVVRAHFARNEPDEALESAGDAVARFRSVDDSKLEAGAVGILVDALLREDKFEQALAGATDAAERFKSTEDKDSEASMWLLISSVHAKKALFTDMVGALKEAQTLYSASGDHKAEATTLERLSTGLLDMGSVAEALQAARDGVAVASSAGEKLLEASALQNVCRALLEGLARGTTEYANAKEELSKCAEDALVLCQEVGDKKGQACSKELLARVSLLIENNEEAVKLAKEALALYGGPGDEAIRSAALISSAHANLNLGKFYSALWDAKQALSFPGNEDAAMAIISSVHASSGRQLYVGPVVSVGGYFVQ